MADATGIEAGGAAGIARGTVTEGKEGVFAALVEQTAAWHEAAPGTIDAIPNPWKMKLPTPEPSGQATTADSLQKDLLGAFEKIEGLTGGLQSLHPTEESLEGAVPADHGLAGPLETGDALDAPGRPATPLPEDSVTPKPADLRASTEPGPDAQVAPSLAKIELAAAPSSAPAGDPEAALRIAPQAPAQQPLSESSGQIPAAAPAETSGANRIPAGDLPQGDRDTKSKAPGAPPAEAQRTAGLSSDNGGFSGNSAQDQGQNGKQPLVTNPAGTQGFSAAASETATTLPATALGSQGATSQGEFAGALDRAAGRTPAGAANQSEQLALRIQTAVSTGQDRISLQLHPAELGRIDVQLDIAEDGRLRGAILAERSEALDLLQRDVRLLERALNDAGLKTDSGSFSFDLREQSAQDKAFARGDERHGDGTAEDKGAGREGAEAQGRQTHHDGLLDLTV